MNHDYEETRKLALDKIDRSERGMKWLIALIALVETTLVILLILNTNWKDDTHVLIFISTFLIYGVLGLGLVALGYWINLNTLKVLKAVHLTSED